MMELANPYSDPKLYIWLVIEGFLDFLKYIAKVDLKGMSINIESEISHINYGLMGSHSRT